MSDVSKYQKLHMLKNKDKWWDLLSRFIDVLRINMFIIDSEGSIFLPPEESKYGGGLLFDRSLGYDLFKNNGHIMEQFDAQDQYFETINRYDLSSYALPINTSENQVIGYLIVGPLILNARLDHNHYKNLAKELGADPERVIGEINQVRVVSNVMIKSILDLLSDIVRDSVNLITSEVELKKMRNSSSDISKKFDNLAQEIYATVRTDELLASLLDVAMKMTDTECGSIMLLDTQKDELSIKVSRGLDKNRIQSQTRLGEGISGIAAQENQLFFIDDDVRPENNRIKEFLNRSEIKQSAVVPIVVKDEVIGVMNLHTKKDVANLEGSLNNLQYLSNLLSSAI